MSDLNLIFTLQSVVLLEDINDEIPANSVHTMNQCVTIIFTAQINQRTRTAVSDTLSRARQPFPQVHLTLNVLFLSWGWQSRCLGHATATPHVLRVRVLQHQQLHTRARRILGV